MFEPIELKWKGEVRVIPSERCLRMIAAIEDIVTLGELTEYARRGNAPLAKIAMAYGSVLRIAGYSVTDDEVYCGMFSDGGKNAGAAVHSLLGMMIPPESALGNGERPGKSNPVERKSSKRSTKSQ